MNEQSIADNQTFPQDDVSLAIHILNQSQCSTKTLQF